MLPMNATSAMGQFVRNNDGGVAYNLLVVERIPELLSPVVIVMDVPEAHEEDLGELPPMHAGATGVTPQHGPQEPAPQGTLIIRRAI